MKTKRIISILGLDKSISGMLTSYCFLLKQQLKDQWVVDNLKTHSEIVFTSYEYRVNLESKPKIMIVLGETDKLVDKETNGIFNISYPICSTKIINVLNKVSNHNSVQKNNNLNTKDKFSFKNLFSRFITRPNKVIKGSFKKDNSSQNVANLLLKLNKSNTHKNLKVVFLGRPASGKTTMIESGSTDKALTSEVKATDSVGLIKDQTTIGIDYGQCELDNNIKLRLYGTPGQVRYDYVQTQTVARADIYVILVDLSSVAPYTEFMHYKKIVDTAGNPDALRVVAFTHYDVKLHNVSQLSKEIRHKCKGEILTAIVDPRKSKDVNGLLIKIAKMKLDGDVYIQQYYEQNSMFLRVV